MITRVDHIDIRVKEFDKIVELFENMGLSAIRNMPERNSVEMALPGANQVVFEIHRVCEGDSTGIHHIAFKSEGDGDDVALLKSKGITFKGEKKLIVHTGRTVSSFTDENHLTWQLTD